ncbi:hypothetical protein V6N13_012207 [Hibiscus sabdariffa]|uniref:Uncharacterized protein n=1 Tax=Hibiscus sabdariffa TaxID=183260 RepID=A0ABR2SEL4_9ROSI
MVFRLNPGGEGEAAKAKAEAEAEAEAEGVEKGQSWWFQEKKGSVFPVKKKLVKTMMVEYIAKSFSTKMGGSSRLKHQSIKVLQTQQEHHCQHISRPLILHCKPDHYSSNNLQS